uniref:Uncharacterized protein n=1 Tax=Oryza nivara TaxID=4536 RepID=A0A0E0FFR2_ORYNI
MWSFEGKEPSTGDQGEAVADSRRSRVAKEVTVAPVGEKAKRGREKGARLLADFGRAEGGESAWEREALPPRLGHTRAAAQRWGRRQSGRGRLRGAGGPGRTATEGGWPPRRERTRERAKAVEV